MAAELSTSGDDFSVNGGKITGLADGVDPTDAANVSQLGGGGVPDPSGEPDGDVLTVATGAAVWSPAAGGAPSGAAGGALDGTYPNPGLAASVAGDGLAESTNVLSVNVDGATIETSSDALRVKDGGITEAKLGLANNTTADVSITKHGFAPIAPNDATKYLDGVGAYSTPSGSGISPNLFDANTILKADSDNTPVALTMGASTILARFAAGNIVAATPSELRTLLALVVGTNVQAWDADLDTVAAVGAAGTFPKSNGSALAYAFPPGHEVAYVERTTPLAVTATTAAAAQEFVSAGAISFDGSTVVLIEFFVPYIDPPVDGNIIVNLWDASTDLGRIANVAAVASGSTTAVMATPIYVARRLTPTNASHTYKAMAWRVTGNGNIFAGAGGTDPAYLPAFIRITRV